MQVRHLRWVAIPLAIAVLFLLRANFADAAAGARADENDVTGFDIKEITFSDTNEICEEGGSPVECITYGLEAHDAFGESDPGAANIVWDLDLTGNGVFQDGLDGCFRIARAGVLRATLFDDGCGQTSRNVYAVTATADKLTFKVPKADLDFGLQTRTRYGMKITVTSSSDVVPNAGADALEHCLGATACAGSTTPPGTTAPGTTAPSTTAPGTTAPATTAPVTTAPGSTAPPAVSTTACVGLPTPTPTASPTTSPATSPTATPTAPPTASPTGSPAATSSADTTGTGTQSKTTAARGESLTISGTGFKSSSPLVMTLCSTPLSLGSSTSTSTGSFSATVSIPTNATVGSHTIVVEGPKPTTGTHRLRFPITVAVASTGGTNTGTGSTLGSSGGTSAASSASDPSKLPSTGSPIIVLAIAAMALMMIGGAAIDGAVTLKRRVLALPTPSIEIPAAETLDLRWGATGDPTSYED